jgi:hypothetical protein
MRYAVRVGMVVRSARCAVVLLVGCGSDPTATPMAKASCTPTEGGANPLDASACANLPPVSGTSPQCYSDGIAAACVVGQTYACVAPPPSYPYLGDAGAQTVPPAACVVGKTFCYRFQPTFVGTLAMVSCPKVPDACANNPSCACFAARHPITVTPTVRAWSPAGSRRSRACKTDPLAPSDGGRTLPGTRGTMDDGRSYAAASSRRASRPTGR